MKTTLHRWDRIEERLQQLADNDAEWWPFVGMRPEPQQQMSGWRCLLLACLYTIPATLLAVVLGMAADDYLDAVQLSALVACTTTAVFVLLHVGLARVWNRRAVRLRAAHQRRQSFFRA